MLKIDIQKRIPSALEERNIHFKAEIANDEIIGLYGASGIGKTSILRMIAGLLTPDAGKIIFDTQVWFDAQLKKNWRPQKRNVGFVFQDYALFPNMNVRQNLAFALPKGESEKSIDSFLEMAELSAFATRSIDTLSGGQKQAVALIRALVQRPNVLLLDEPLTAIDGHWRGQLIALIQRIHQEYQIPILFVSHSEREIQSLCNAVILIENGSNLAPQSPNVLLE